MNQNARMVAVNALQCDAEDLEARPMQAGFFKYWRFWRCSDSMMPPNNVIVATHDSTARVVKDQKDFNLLIEQEPVRLTNDDDVHRYIDFFVSITSPMAEILKTINDVPGISDSDRRRWQAIVEPPRVRSNGSAYIVTSWVWSDGALERMAFDVDQRGAVNVTREVVGTGVGIVISIE